MSTTHQSPSGKYTLTIEYDDGAWESRGTVTNATGHVVAVIERNYHSFPFLFIENHPSGKSFFVAGADYQGQTVIELDTGRRLDYLPEEAAKGHAFCWEDYLFDETSQLLVVDGCYWACPYMIRFYDFSDPMNNGWPEVAPYASEADDKQEWIDPDVRAPEIKPDGTIITYQSERIDDEADDSETRPLPPIAATRTWRRDGNKLILVSDDVTPAEQERRDKSEQARIQWGLFVANYKETDLLWLRTMELIQQAPFIPSDHMSIGQTHKDWCPHWDGEERRFCRGVYKSDKLCIEIEIAHATGPVKLDVWRDGNNEPEWFEHSVVGVDAAMVRARELINHHLS